jgi:hypothetical protein
VSDLQSHIRDHIEELAAAEVDPTDRDLHRTCLLLGKFSRHTRVNQKNREIVKNFSSLTNFKEKLVSVRNAFFKGIYKPKKGEKRSILRSCGPARVGPMGYERKHGRV